MKKILTTDNLKIKFLGITPVLEDKTGFLNPQEIVSLSGLATFKGRSIKKLLKEIESKGETLEQEMKGILQKSSLIGHASVATTPTLCLSYEGSKFLDSALTGIIFSSSLVSSGRRTGTSEEDIVFPKNMLADEKAKKIYQETSEEIIKFFNFLLSKKTRKDEASKILQYGIYGTGIIQLPIESIISLKREYLNEKEWMPEEIGILIKEIENNVKKLGIDILYTTREAAPRNVYHYPNIFKNPNNSNIVREIIKKTQLINGAKLVSVETFFTPGLKKKLAKLEKINKSTFSSLKAIKKNWFELIALRREILRDYNSALRIKVLSSVPWRIWGEKKRHRTCPQVIESIYYSINRASNRFNKFKREIKAGRINNKIIQEIEQVFSIPPSIKSNSGFLNQYLLVALKSFETYQNLIKLKIMPRDAIFIIPRAVKIDILQEYDLYNLLIGYYPLRLCSTAEEEMRRNTLNEVKQIKKALTKIGHSWLNKFIAPKCESIGFCPEVKSCFYIKNLVKNYNEKFHQEMKQELKKKFKANLNNLEK